MKFIQSLIFISALILVSDTFPMGSSRPERELQRRSSRRFLFQLKSPRIETPTPLPFNQEDFKDHESFIKTAYTSLREDPQGIVTEAKANLLHDYLITVDPTSQALLQDKINYIEERIWKQTSGNRYKEYKETSNLHEAVSAMIRNTKPPSLTAHCN